MSQTSLYAYSTFNTENVSIKYLKCDLKGKVSIYISFQNKRHNHQEKAYFNEMIQMPEVKKKKVKWGNRIFNL